MTRGSLRSCQSSWPWPTSSATTLRGAALQQHVGESAGRRADVERARGRAVDREGVERAGELEAAAADVGMVRSDERDVRVRHRPARRPWRRPGRRPDLAGEDQRARPLARRREPALDESESRRVLPGLITRQGRQRRYVSWCSRSKRRIALALRSTIQLGDVGQPAVGQPGVARAPRARAAMHSAASARERSRPKSAG